MIYVLHRTIVVDVLGNLPFLAISGTDRRKPRLRNPATERLGLGRQPNNPTASVQ